MLKTSLAPADAAPAQPACYRAGLNEQLACSLAHDLNNVLQIISGNLSLLSKETAKEGVAARRIASAMAGVELGARLTRRVLDQRTRGAIAEAPVDLMTACKDVLGLIENAIGPNVDLHFDIGPNIHTLAVDGTGFGHALLNLAINGRDAMNGTGCLRIHIVNCPDGGVGLDAAVLVSVADEGCGMAADLVPRAFEPFVTTKPRGQGTGLGLSGVQDFATRSGATIFVDSRPGKGTMIRLRMPCKPARAVPSTISQPPSSGPFGSPAIISSSLQSRRPV